MPKCYLNLNTAASRPDENAVTTPRCANPRYNSAMDTQGGGKKGSGYLRPARVVFLTGHTDGLAAEAADWANRHGAGWMEARARRLAQAGGNLACCSKADLEWGDLLVTLDAAALADMPCRPTHMQHRHYPFEPGAASSGQLLSALHGRIEGMLGGLRLMQRAASSE